MRATVPAAMWIHRSVVSRVSIPCPPQGRGGSAAPRTGSAPLEPLERADRLRTPREHRAAAVLAVVQGDQRERQLRMACQLFAQAALDADIHLELCALACLVLRDLGDVVGDPPVGAEKELQQ